MQPWINYNHLYYFWVVAQEGSIARASERLMLAPPTISAQIRALEQELRVRLFDRTGRSLVLTESGRMVFRHADEMFTTGRELLEALQGRMPGRPMRLTIGIVDVMPKLVVYQLVRPALRLPDAIQLVCRDGPLDRLLADLAVHSLDLVLSDAPAGPEVRVRAFNHQLGECGVTIFGTAELASRLQGSFPASLDGAPILLPVSSTTLRRALDHWFETIGIRPIVRGEFEDSALLKVFGQSGEGFFPAPSVVEDEVVRQYNVQIVGRVESIRERFYAISIERKLKHPAVLAISEAARAAFSSLGEAE